MVEQNGFVLAMGAFPIASNGLLRVSIALPCQNRRARHHGREVFTSEEARRMMQDNDRSRDPAQFSDKALSILVFAAYHRLASGERVTEVVHHDNAGHSADQQGVEELRAAGLVRFDGRKIGRAHV